MCGPRFFRSVFLLLFLGSDMKLLSAQGVATVERSTALIGSTTPPSWGVTTPQSEGDLTSLSGRSEELADESTSTGKSNLTSAVDVTTISGPDNGNEATAVHTAAASTEPEPEDSGTTATEAISMATSPAQMMMTLSTVSPALSAVAATQILTAMVTDAGTSGVMTSATTQQLTDSELTTSPQRQDNGDVIDVLSSTTASILHSSKLPTPSLTTSGMTPSPQTPVPTAPPAPALTTVAVTASEAVSMPLSPSVKTTPSALTTDLDTTHEQTRLLPAFTDADLTAFTVNVVRNSNVQSESKNNDPVLHPSWLLVSVIIGSILTVAVLCVVVVFIKRRKASSRHDIVWGQRSKKKKKKGVDDDTWAGPVKLEGREKAELEGPGEGLGQDVTKNGEGVNGTLSTFVMLDEHGVGRDGSKEVQQWEEQEPLLFIDEDAKPEDGEGDAKEAGTKDSAGELGTTETRETPLNGDTFCLTTAV